MPPRLILEHPVSDPGWCLYLSSALVLPCPNRYVGNLVGNLHIWLAYGHPNTGIASLPTLVTARYRSSMDNHYWLKRGDPVVIDSESREGH
jgi:hypothetical protein